MSGLVGEEALKLAQSAWKIVTTGKGFEKSLKKVVIVSAGQGNCMAEFEVEEGMTNRGGTLHGGCTTTLVDCITTLGLMTSNKNQNPGVSVNLTVNFLKSSTIGNKIVVSSTTYKSGRRLAFMEAVFKNKDTGDVVAIGNHLKFVGD